MPQERPRNVKSQKVGTNNFYVQEVQGSARGNKKLIPSVLVLADDSGEEGQPTSQNEPLLLIRSEGALAHLKQAAYSYISPSNRSTRRCAVTNGSSCSRPPSGSTILLERLQDFRQLPMIVSYVCIWTLFYLLVHHSEDSTSTIVGEGADEEADHMKPEEEYAILRSVTFVFVVEMIKTFVNLACYLKSEDCCCSQPTRHSRGFQASLLLSSLSKKIKPFMLKYMPVAVLYALYNNLMFLNLKSNNPLTYLVISSSRLVLTTVAWQMHFKGQPLTPTRKAAIALIVLGIISKDMPSINSTPAEDAIGDQMNEGQHALSSYEGSAADEDSFTSYSYLSRVMMIVLQMYCSVFAGIYNEKILKDHDENQFLQNISLNIDSIIINILIGLVEVVRLKRRNVLDPNMTHLGINTFKKSPASAVMIVLTLAIAGIMSATLLRYVTSITKGVASASEIVLTSFIEYLYFGHLFGWQESLGIFFVSLGTVLYCVIPSKGEMKRKPNPSFLHRASARIRFIIITCALVAIAASSSHLSSYPIFPDYAAHDIGLLNQSIFMLNKEEELPQNTTYSCTKNETVPPFPSKKILSLEKYQRVKEAERIVAYIVGKLGSIGAPVSLMYGTLLHEFRNGTGSCVQYNIMDKDFDIAVFETHFHDILAMGEEIKTLFGWEVKFVHEEALFLMLFPANKKKRGRSLFQIDVYGFRTDHPRKGLIHFPWDDVTVAADAFLPLVKHKAIASNEDNHDVLNRKPQLHFYYRPFNPSCLLANLYGSDFMTPKKGHFIRKKAFDDPKCDRSKLNDEEKAELERQLVEYGRTATTTNKDDTYYTSSTTANSTSTEKMRTGFLSCIRSQDDIIFALDLAHTFEVLLENSHDAPPSLELYHYGGISPFLTARLEQKRSVQVIEIRNAAANFNTCIADSLAMTSLDNAIVVDPSTVLIHKSAKENYTAQQRIRWGSFSRTRSTEINLALFGTVVSTSVNIDRALAFASSHEGFHFRHIFSYQSIMKNGLAVEQEVLTRDGSGHFGILHLTKSLPFHFVRPNIAMIRWSSYHGSGKVVCSSDCSNEILVEISAFLQRFKEWKATLLLDRPVGWVAFDGGLVQQSLINSTSAETNCSSFNSVLAAKKSIRASNSSSASIVNIDLVLTSDEKNVAMHSDESIGPIPYGQLMVSAPSTRTLLEVQRDVRNPCLSNDFIHKWFDSNPYHSYPECLDANGGSLGISSVEAFLDIILEENAKIIFDLKSNGKQELQLQKIQSMIHASGRSDADTQKLIDNIGIRYFVFTNKGKVELDVFPSQLRKLAAATAPKSFKRTTPKVFINAPSMESCLALAKWAEDQGGRLGGCFIIEGHAGVAKKWEDASREYNLQKTLRSSFEDLKLICDVPREQAQPDTSLWRNGLVSCVEDGYDWIHHPFPVAPKADYSRGMASFSVIDSTIIDETLVADALSVLKGHLHQKPQNVSSQFPNYESKWGVTSPYFWKPQDQHFLFLGDRQRPETSDASTFSSQSNDHEFRCVTKILTVMLFLRLQEMGLLSIDDVVAGSGSKYGYTYQNQVTWKHIFTNTAGTDGSHAGNKFEYSNAMWSHVSGFVESLTGVPFVEAIKFYISDPMGLTGSFDETTQYPPFAARGFRGSNEDLLTIGSTLASGGVSPKTRKRVVSSSSVERMLHDWTDEQNVRASFARDKTVGTMKRFRYGEDDSSFSSHGVVDGYGMGLWRVNGWRTRDERKYPVRGWLAMGSSEALMYFDEDGVVVGMCASQRVVGLELTSTFATVVRELGSRVDSSFQVANQRLHIAAAPA